MDKIDDIDSILDVAGEILTEYAGESGDTRIERLARWVVNAVGGAPYDEDYAMETLTDHNIDLSALDNEHTVREVAVALLRMCEISQE